MSTHLKWGLALITACIVSFQFGKHDQPTRQLTVQTSATTASSSDMTQNSSVNIGQIQGFEITTPKGLKITGKQAENLNLSDLLKLTETASTSSTTSMTLVENDLAWWRAGIGHAFSTDVLGSKIDRLNRFDLAHDSGWTLSGGLRLGKTPAWVDAQLIPAIGGGTITLTIEGR